MAEATATRRTRRYARSGQWCRTFERHPTLRFQVAFTEHINNTLSKDAFLSEGGYIPMDAASADLFVRTSDGILLCKLINAAQAETVDERVLNYPVGGKPLNLWERQENQNVVINSAKAIGCQVVNIHAP